MYICNGMLLSHKKEWYWVISRDMDGPTVCHTECSRSEGEKQYLYQCIYMESRQMVQMNLFSGQKWRHRQWTCWHRGEETDGMNWEMETDIYTLLLLLSRFSHVRLCATPYTAAHQAPPSLEFSRQEHWSGLPFPSPMHESKKWKWSRSVVSDSSRPLLFPDFKIR